MVFTALVHTCTRTRRLNTSHGLKELKRSRTIHIRSSSVHGRRQPLKRHHSLCLICLPRWERAWQGEGVEWACACDCCCEVGVCERGVVLVRGEETVACAQSDGMLGMKRPEMLGNIRKVACTRSDGMLGEMATRKCKVT